MKVTRYVIATRQEDVEYAWSTTLSANRKRDVEKLLEKVSRIYHPDAALHVYKATMDVKRVD